MSNGIQDLLKVCSSCQGKLPVVEFPIRQDTGKPRASCRKCMHEKQNSYYLKNKEAYRERERKYYKNDPEKFLQKNKEYRFKNADKLSESAKSKRCTQEYRTKAADFSRNFRKNNESYRIASNFSRRVRFFIKEPSNRGYEKLVGCNKEKIGSLIGYSEGQEIDHVIPCSFFDLTIENERMLCFNWRNLRCVTLKHNRKKSNALPVDWMEIIEKIESEIF